MVLDALSSESLTRRDFIERAGKVCLTLGSLPLLEHQVTSNLKAAQMQIREAADAVLVLWLEGGASRQETWDPSFSTCQEVRGPFQSIATSVPGVRVCENFPQIAKLMDKIALVRSYQTKKPDHFTSSDEILTPLGAPTLGSIVGPKKAKGSLPYSLIWVRGTYQPDGAHQVQRSFRIDEDKDKKGVFHPPKLGNTNSELLQRRAKLLEILDCPSFDTSNPQVQRFTKNQELAFDLSLGGGRLAEAFDLPEKEVKDFGNTSVGRGTLLGLRLIERGAGFVTVHDGEGRGWDQHTQITDYEPMSRRLDHTMATIIRYIEERRFTKKILFMVMGEFARTYKVNSGGGRHHWNKGFSGLWFGHGIQPGVVGATKDRDITRDPIDAEGTIANTILKITGVDTSPQRKVIDQILA